MSYVISPVTEDFDTVRHVLPAVSTDLVHWQGSRPSAAFDRARRLLMGQPQENSHALLLISDGDFAEPGLEEYAALLERSGVRLYVLGVGTPAGGKVPALDGGWLHGADGEVVISRLEEARLKALAEAGGGIYWKADYRDTDVLALLRRLADVHQPQTGAMTQRIWNERFPLPVGLMLVLLLLRFRSTRSDIG